MRNLTQMTYAELRDTINTSCGVLLLSCMTVAFNVIAFLIFWTKCTTLDFKNQTLSLFQFIA